MKFEIELDEEIIRKSIESITYSVVNSYLKSYNVENEIQRIIRKYWDELVPSIVVEELKNSDALRKEVREAIKRKLRAQLTKLMKGS